MKTIEKILKAMDISTIEENPYRERFYQTLNLIKKQKGAEFTHKDFYIALINIRCAKEEKEANEKICREKGHIEGTYLLGDGYKK
jgi:hypothetical protein